LGIFDPVSKETKRSKIENAQIEMEEKVRKKAKAKGFSVEGAIYVLEAMFPKDDEPNKVSRPFVSIYPDKVVQNRKSLFNSSSEEIPLDKITSVEITTGMIPSINIFTSGNTLTFRTDVLQGPKFVEVLRKNLPKKGTALNRGSSDLEQLEKLASLFERGHITKKEFDLKKKEILGL
jgi:hypothetical protein